MAAECQEYTYLDENGEEQTGKRLVDVRTPEEEALRERQALADADGRRDYSQAEIVAQAEANAPLPYVDVLELGMREPGDRPTELATVDPVEPDVAAKAEADALAQAEAAKAEAEAEGRRQELEAERDRVNQELEGLDGGK